MSVRVCIHRRITCAHSVHACMNAVYACDGYSARVTNVIQYTMCFPNHTMNMAKRATVQQTQIRTPLPVNEIANAPSSLYICSNGLGEDNNKRDTQRRTVAKRVGKNGLPNNDKKCNKQSFQKPGLRLRNNKGVWVRDRGDFSYSALRSHLRSGSESVWQCTADRVQDTRRETPALDSVVCSRFPA